MVAGIGAFTECMILFCIIGWVIWSATAGVLGVGVALHGWDFSPMKIIIIITMQIAIPPEIQMKVLIPSTIGGKTGPEA